MHEARKLPVRTRQVIAWGWLTCLVITTLEAFITPLRFSSVELRSWVHSLAWLLAFSGAAYFARYTTYSPFRAAWRVWPWAQWALALALPCYFFGMEAPYAFANFFWQAHDSYYDEHSGDTDFSLLRCGSERIYFRRTDYIYEKEPVVVRWLPLGLRWQTPLGNQRLDSTWTVLDAQTLQLIVPPDQLRALMPVGWVAPSINDPLSAAEVPAAEPALAPPLPPLSHVAPDEERVYTYIEQMPTLPDGGSTGAMVVALQQRLVLPPAAQEGRVIVAFIVRPTGKVTSAHIVQGLNASTDTALLAAVDKLPTFIPGKQNGRTVSVSITLPIAIKKK